MEHQDKKEPRLISYYVNGELQSTENHKLDVRTILEKAGFQPVEEYKLMRDNGNHVFEDLSTEIPIHDNEKFTALYKGPTPTS